MLDTSVVKIFPFDDVNTVCIKCDDIGLTVYCTSVTIASDLDSGKHTVSGWINDKKACELSVIPADLHVHFYHAEHGEDLKSALIRDYRGM